MHTILACGDNLYNIYAYVITKQKYMIFVVYKTSMIIWTLLKFKVKVGLSPSHVTVRTCTYIVW